MVRTIRARFSRGGFEPLAPATSDIVCEGQGVLITISTESGEVVGDTIRGTTGGWKDLIDADALKRNIYSEQS